MIDQLRGQYQAITAAAGAPPGDPDITVLVDAGQNSAANFTHLADQAALHRVGPGQRLPGPDRPARHRAHHRG